jgi:hypothetical protein
MPEPVETRSDQALCISARRLLIRDTEGKACSSRVAGLTAVKTGVS